MANPALFTQKIKEYINEDGRSQASVARLLGHNPDTFNKWVHLINRMPDTVIYEFCQLLNLNDEQRAELLNLAGYATPPVVTSTSLAVINSLKNLELTAFEHQVMRLLLEKKTIPHIARLMEERLTIIEQMLTYDETRSTLFYKLGAQSLPEAEQRYKELYGDLLAQEKLVASEENTPPTWEQWLKDSFSPYIFSLTIVYLTTSLVIFLPIWLLSCKTCLLNTFESLYAVIPLCGALFGFVGLLRRHTLINQIPAPLLLWCLGFLVWSSGSLMWTYYKVVFGIEVPYPSLADVGYFSNNLLWIGGMRLLLNHLEPNVLRKTAALRWTGGILLGGLIVIMLFVRGWQPHPDDPTKFILDVAYPLTSGFTAVLVALWFTEPSFKKLGNTMKWGMWIIFLGIILLFIADLGLNILTTFPKNHPWAYYNGAWPDFVYATALYILGVGILSMPRKTMEQVMTVAQLSEQLVQWVIHKQRWVEKLFDLKTCKDKAPKINIFFQRLNPFVYFPKLLIKFIMTFNLSR